MSLKEQLERAVPGETITFTGMEFGGKIQGVRGREGAPITLEGANAETARIIPDPTYSAAALRFEDCEYLRLGKFTIHGEGQVDRALQVFRSDHVEIYDLITVDVPEDHVHIVGCNHVLIKRFACSGQGGRPMGGGKGPHGVYFTRVDGGGDCEDLVARDCSCESIAGAAFQANGDGAILHGVVFRRCYARDYGILGGSGVNLAQCRDPLLEDISLYPHARSDNPGIASYDGTTGTVMNRYEIECDELWSGPMTATPGMPLYPQSPNLGPDPEPPEPEPIPPEPEEPPAEPIRAVCSTCNATGQVLAPGELPGGETVACQTCAGAGWIAVG